MHLVDYTDAAAVKQVPTRNGFGTGLIEAGERDKNVIAICADLSESVRMEAFKKRFPDRYVAIGVAEQLLVAMAAGLASTGQDPVHRELRDVQPGPVVGASAHHDGAQRDQREDRGRARRRVRRPRRRDAPGDRGHRDHARDPEDDRRRAVRLQPDAQSDARGRRDVRPDVPALRPRRVRGRSPPRTRRSSSARRRRSAKAATSPSSRAASSSTRR